MRKCKFQYAFKQLKNNLSKVLDIRVETCGAIYPLDENETKQKK